ncbi:MAG: C45 family autoproteolytic acyltransferase/hydrolase [Planctomycetota bacterium]|nr:C45 family autoproteolytic acyltransferase/hydrolase [Planctomycetota bacterium]
MKKYHVDLMLPPTKRWEEIIEDQRTVGPELLDEIMEIFKMGTGLGGLGSGLISRALATVQKFFGGDTDFHKDMLAFAKGWNRPVHEIVVANLSYELSHSIELVPDFQWRKIFGCTAVCQWTEKFGWIHGRNMDWSIPALGPGSIEVVFDGPAGRFSTLTWPGFVGVLQGVAKQRFSATINYAPPDGLGPQWPSSFLLRSVFEHCPHFADAVEFITETDVAASSFFTLCGLERDEALVIEKTRLRPTQCRASLPADAPALIQTNNFMLPDNQDLNAGFSQLLASSQERHEWARMALLGLEIRDVSDIESALDDEPVLNSETVQQMILEAKSGRALWRGL